MWGLGVDILLRVSVPSVTPPISFGPRQADFPKGMGWGVGRVLWGGAPSACSRKPLAPLR